VVILGIASASNADTTHGSSATVIIFVDADATGSATGLDWTDAYTNLQDALAVAISGDQIWVAQGIYYPDQGVSQTNNVLTSTFTITNGIALYGGFDPGSGIDSFTERDWDAHLTVLSGDVDHETFPDLTDSLGVVTNTANIRGTNVFHVVSTVAVTETALIDGFTITGGRAYGTYVPLCEQGCGGGMHNTESISLTLSNLTFSGNWANIDGGGMFNTRGSSPSLANVTFYGNTADDFGGGMSNERKSSPTLTSVTFSANHAGFGGGMYNFSNSDPTLNNVSFYDNSAEYGGGMYNYRSSPTMTNVTFSGNSAADRGGGMYNGGFSNPTLTHMTFSSNTAATRGGGIFNTTGSNPTLTDLTFHGNSADYGGGMYIHLSLPTLTNLSFTANSALYGAGMYNELSTPLLTNLTFSGNTARDGGGIYNSRYSSPTLTNVTISGNSADYGGGIYNDDHSDPTLINVILWGNIAVIHDTSQIFNTTLSSTPYISFSDIQDSGGSGANWDPSLGRDEGGNIDGDPLFVRNPDPGPFAVWDGWRDDYGDLHLQLNSPAIDAGTNIGCPDIDMDGNPRPLNDICDMGAYEAGYSMVYLPLVTNHIE
jgi:predicted outer membrane repeat protein